MTIAFKQGFTRNVIIIKNWVIKFPRFNKNFLLGVKSNREENDCWLSRGGRQDLCPVHSIWLQGFFVIMPHLDILTPEEWEEEGLNSESAYSFYDDNKPTNWGWYENNPVLVDYGLLT